MTDIAESSRLLMGYASELDRISKQLVTVEEHIAAQEPQIEDFIESFVTELWRKHDEEGAKLPPADVRQSMAKAAVEKELMAAYRANVGTRRRAKARLSDLRELVAAQRSIVSAAKTELEAVSGPVPAWSGGRDFPSG